MPSPALGPEEVVEGVVGALRASRETGAGTLWEFAAQKLRGSVGGKKHLLRLLGNELFAPLCEWGGLDAAPLERIGDSARQMLMVAQGDEKAYYLVSLALSKRDDRRDCWLITGLERLQ